MSRLTEILAGDRTPTVIPPRVEAAQDFLRFAQDIKSPSRHPWNSDGPPEADGELSPQENAVYQAALGVLGLYFRGEMDYGDVPPMSAAPRKDDEQDPPVMAKIE